MTYAIVIEESATGFSAYVPDLPGCVAVGNSREEVERLIRGAIELHLRGMREDGIEPPVPTTSVALIDVEPPDVAGS